MSLQFIDGPVGRLQLLQEVPAGEPLALAVICHPHPLHGGTLNNKIVHQLARTFNQLEAISVRFNFRGAGDSDGRFDHGQGELDDLLAVADWARARWPGLPLWLAGFSFGGYVALSAAAALRPQRMVTVAPAVGYFGDACPEIPSTDWLVIQGSDDDVVRADAVGAFLDRLDVNHQLAVVEGAGHFFHGRLNELKNLVLAAFAG